MKQGSWAIAMVLALAVLAIGRNALAVTGQLELFADSHATSCALADAPGLISVFVFQTAGEASTAVGWFAAPKPACWNATWIADNVSNATKVGGSQTAISVGFGICRPLPAFVLEILFISAGATPPCCEYSLTVPQGKTLAYLVCDTFWEQPLTIGRKVTINPDASCPCMLPVATEASTWGRVKSLYR